MNIREYLRVNWVYGVFLLLGLGAITIIKGYEIGLFLTIFLLEFALIGYSIVGSYNYFRKIKEKGLPLIILAAIILSIAVYFFYGILTLSRMIIIPIVISGAVILYIRRTNN